MAGGELASVQGSGFEPTVVHMHVISDPGRKAQDGQKVNVIVSYLVSLMPAWATSGLILNEQTKTLTKTADKTITENEIHLEFRGVLSSSCSVLTSCVISSLVTYLNYKDG